MHFPLLQDIILLLGFAVGIVFVFQRFKLPSILGFLVTGIIIGPYGLSLISAVHEVEILAEIGVILLLFVIGMEFSLKQLAAIRRTVFIGGLLQVGLAIGATTALFTGLGYAWNTAVFIGFLFSLSSTAIVLKMLQDRDEINAPHGRVALGFLIFQDIIVVPMMLVTPLLAGQSGDLWSELLGLLIKSAGVIVFTIVSARYLVPWLMHQIAKTGSKELFLLTTITLCFAVAYLTSEVGLSLALGAFLAGLIISESEYSHQATGTILPFRELFTSFFFVSIGMLLDLSFFIQHFGMVILIVLAVFIAKSALVAGATALLRYPSRTILLTGLALFQVGEFSFILSKVGIDAGLLTTGMNQYFLSVSILTMAVTPFVMMYSRPMSRRVLRALSKSDHYSREEAHLTERTPSKWQDHLLIIGYGVNGRNVARAARYANIPYLILELNAETVRREKARGEDILYGDAVYEHVLHEVHVERARMVTIAISDPEATKTIVSNIRGISQTVHIVVRTRFVREIDELISLGADEVIPEEFETSIEIFSRVLHQYLVPMDQMEQLVREIRSDNYDMLRPSHHPRRGGHPVRIPDLNIECIRVLADSGPVVGKSLADSHVRRNYKINVLAISRKEKTIVPVSPEEIIKQHDLLFVSGNREQISAFYNKVV